MFGWIALLAGLAATAQVSPRPEVSVVVVTLDEARQGQSKHGRALLDTLGDDRFGRYAMRQPTIPTSEFPHCEDDHPDHGLNFCVRFNLHRAWTEGATPTVVVVFTDQGEGPEFHERSGRMRALCYGRGARAADPAAQDIWLWPASARVHGVRDWNRDRNALAGCIDAALSEPPGEPRPD